MSKKKTKDEITLENYKNHVGEWVCSICASGSSQPAKNIQNLRGLGYAFKETSTGRYAKQCFCEKCRCNRTHYMLLSAEPTFDEKTRCIITPEQRERIIPLFESRDAFTGAKITTRAEIDHKKPFARLEQDIDVSLLSDEEIKKHFQLLTRDHNLLKDRKCQQCIKTNKRPSFLGKKYWYAGDEKFTGDCEGCGYYDGVKWTEEFNKEEVRETARKNLITYLYKYIDSNK